LSAVPVFVILASAQSLTLVVGTWEWRGAAGWQRITLELESGDTGLAGRIRMGPGGGGEPQEASWEYFFEPAVFELSAISVEGGRIRFEHFVGGEEEKLFYFGEVDGDRIIVVREASEIRGSPDTLGDHRVTFTLERVR
jgi:hypothetical protein